MSQCFEPYRAIGLVTDSVCVAARVPRQQRRGAPHRRRRRSPFALQKRGREHFVSASIGHAFQIYDAAHLHTRFVSGLHAARIAALATRGDCTFVAAGAPRHTRLSLSAFGRSPIRFIALCCCFCVYCVTPS